MPDTSTLNRYVAFLRGMNLGKRRIKNPELLAIFTQLGLHNCGAFLASGNVVFDSSETSEDTLRNLLETGLEDALGYPVATFIRSRDETLAVSTFAPFDAARLDRTAGKLQVMFLQSAPGADGAALVQRLDSAADGLRLNSRELYWLPEGNMSNSTLDLKTLEREIGPTTTRTHRTVKRLSAKFLV